MTPELPEEVHSPLIKWPTRLPRPLKGELDTLVDSTCLPAEAIARQLGLYERGIRPATLDTYVRRRRNRLGRRGKPGRPPAFPRDSYVDEIAAPLLAAIHSMVCVELAALIVRRMSEIQQAAFADAASVGPLTENP